MVFNALAAWVMLSLSFSGSSGQPVISVHHWKAMEYPARARLARVHGTVSITAILQKSQNPSDYRVGKYEATGHPMLRDAAVKNLRSWSFYCYGCKANERPTYHVTYEFRFDEKCIESECFKRSSTFQSGRVVVETSAPEAPTNYSTK